jgi:peptide/nickel transport system substrate-binding protein
MRKILAAATAAVLAVTATACSGGSSAQNGTTGPGATGGTLDLSAIQPPNTFVPGDISSGPGVLYTQPVYDSLLTNDNDGEPKANVGTEWSYDSTNTTLSVTLRNDVKFSDGTPLNADAVKANLELAKKGKGESAGALKFLDRVDVVDATHVKLVLSAPDPSFLPNLGGASGALASPKALGTDGLKTTPVGSGPYVLDAAKTQPGNKYVYSRNADYWNKAKYPYDTLTVTVFNDNNAILNALRSGQIDVALNVQSKESPALKSAGFNVQSFPAYTTSGLFLFDRKGTLVPALGDVRVRQALNYAFDREAYRQQTAGGEGTSTTQLFNSLSSGYDKSLDSRYTYDVAKAKQLLAEAGYPNGFTLPMPDVSPVYPAQQAATTEALTAIGVTPQYQPVNGQTFIGDLLGGKYPAAIFQLSVYRSWDTAQIALAPGALWNTFHVADPTVVSLIDQAQKETGDQQAATFKKLNQYVVEQGWFVPIIQPNNIFATSKDVSIAAQRYATVPPIWNITPKK